MKTNLKTKVIEVKEVPSIKHLDTLSGIRDKAQAEAWGMKYGYPTVYFTASKQRVYADKLSARVDKKAEALESGIIKMRVTAEDIQLTIKKVEEL